MTLRSAALALWSLAALAGAQRTYIVDASNGPGTDFTDLPPALVTARDGDTIRVRPGLYFPTVVQNKALTIRCEPGATLRADPLRGDLLVAGLAAGKTFSIFGLTTSNTSVAGGVVLMDCLGLVHLQQCTLAALPSEHAPALWVTGCAQVSLTDCTIGGDPAVLVNASRVVGTSLQIAGRVASTGAWAGVGLLGLNGSDVTLSRGACRGTAASGIYAFGGRVTIRGDGQTVVEAVGGNAPAVFATGTAILVDPTVALRPSGGNPDIGGAASSITRQRIPSLTATGGALGGTLTVDLYARAGDLTLVYASAPGAPVAALGGDLWLSGVGFTLIASGVQGPSEHLQVTLPVPANPQLAGLVLATQGLTLSATGTVLSNPALVVIQ